MWQIQPSELQHANWQLVKIMCQMHLQLNYAVRFCLKFRFLWHNLAKV